MGIYNPKDVEPRIQKFWEEEEIYKFDPTSGKNIFSIDTPPPTVSGKMHAGHAFNYTCFDVIARYKKMSGYNVFFPFGTDDNGLATERLIEKLKNVRSKRMQRKEFVKLCLNTLNEIRPSFVADWKRIGMSCDFKLFYTTIDEHCQRISQRSFIELYKQNRVYQKEAPTIWCPECQTAIAQVELKDKEVSSTFNDIVFKVDGEELIISTTRPELLPSCVAIFYNPKDERYKNIKGKYAMVPLFNFEVPVLEDEGADPDKGTGIVMCCTFGDQQDVEWWYHHKLPLKISINKEGKLNENARPYCGLSIHEARKKIIEDLNKEHFLKKQEKIIHVVNVHERCGKETEFLVTKQWFIRYLDLKDTFIELGKRINWYPEFMRVRYDNWINGLKWDWCISRQRFYGIPFPVWYCKNCSEVILADKEKLPVDPLIDKPQTKCPKCNSNEFIPEEDVLDTWATSSLTPKIATGLLKENSKYEKLKDKLFPMTLRPQAQDIVTFWLFNTVVKSWLHYKELPWENVMITGYVLSPNREKMSKSKGNTVEPQDLIKKYSADSLRFWACSVSLGEDLSLTEKEFIAGQKTLVKLWNAAKFSMSNATNQKPEQFEAFDLWLLSKLNKLIKECSESFDKYDLLRSKTLTENFFWHIFCDNYLEIIKERIYNFKKGKEAAQYTLYHSFLTLLKLFAPILPHITEEIYLLYLKKYEKIKSIHINNWPKVDNRFINNEIEEAGDKAIEIISKVRQYKSNLGKSLKTRIILTLEEKDYHILAPFLDDLKAVTVTEKLEIGKFNISLLEE